jgi:hypothetical protein
MQRRKRYYMQDTQYHRPGDRIYHLVDAECPDGLSIPKDDREQGPGEGLNLCPKCDARLKRKAKAQRFEE